MNVAPHEKDADAIGIRKQLERTSPRTAACLQDELPSQSKHEKQELREFQNQLGLVDASEHPKWEERQPGDSDTPSTAMATGNLDTASVST